MTDLFLEYLTSTDVYWWQLPLIFLVGLLTSLTPCVYPLLPITIATLSQSNQSKMAPFLYCVGFATVYAALGFIAASTGQLFGQVASNPWVLIGFANMLLYFAALSKGYITMPAFFGSSPRVYQTPWLMGMASALVAAPCTSPVLGGLLLFVATAQQPVLGALMLFSFALGMSGLLLVAGLSSQFITRLPKSGVWLNYISTFSALILIAMAQYFLIQAGKSWF